MKLLILMCAMALAGRASYASNPDPSFNARMMDIIRLPSPQNNYNEPEPSPPITQTSNNDK